jgi:hypothetical protein
MWPLQTRPNVTAGLRWPPEICERCDRQAVRQRDRDHVVTRRLDRADSDKNQGEGSNKFSDAGTKLFHPTIQANQDRDDNLEALDLRFWGSQAASLQ